MARKPKPSASGTVLRLKQNAFVNGIVEQKGFEKTFSAEDAQLRLTRTRLWETV